jgi:hypothetical protein
MRVIPTLVDEIGTRRTLGVMYGNFALVHLHFRWTNRIGTSGRLNLATHFNQPSRGLWEFPPLSCITSSSYAKTAL